jgi:hypothetical protein
MTLIWPIAMAWKSYASMNTIGLATCKIIKVEKSGTSEN